MEFPVSALLIGIWSTGHCLAMCGGLALAAGQLSRQQLRYPKLLRAMEMLTWQLGRVLSYSLIGFLVGGFGAFFLEYAALAGLRVLGFVAANLMLIALGLHVAQWWSGIIQIERLGELLWRWIAPHATATLAPAMPRHREPIRALGRALRAGAIWGWLPCGLVYSMLITASVSGSSSSGAMWMFAFGLGTIPALWITSMASQEMTQFFKNLWVRRTAGSLIILFGLWGLLRITGVIQVTWLDAFCVGTGAMQ
jgi:sulfite exporter TauE/SafE